MGGAKPGSLRDQRIAEADIFTGEPNMFPRFDTIQNCNRVAVDLAGVFLHDHRIGAGGQGRSGGNADGVPRPERLAENAASRHFALNRQPDGQRFEISGPDRPAIHRRIVEWRKICRAGYRFREMSAGRLFDGNPAGLGVVRTRNNAVRSIGDGCDKA